MFYLFIAIAIFGPFFHLSIKNGFKKFPNQTDVIELYLVYSLFALVGLSGIYAFIGHAFFADRVAAFIGWPTGSPFQFEIAVANLAFGVLGILAIWLRGNFWLAIIIGYSVFLLGAAYGHIHNMISTQNYAPGNAGLILYLDIVVPIVLIALFIALWGSRRINKTGSLHAH